MLLTELPLETALALQFDPDDATVVAALGAAMGLALTGANRAITADELLALWLGPGNWLIKPSMDAAEPILELERAVDATQSSLVDVSDLWFTLRLQGCRSRDVLAKGCALDLHPQVFVPGANAVTQFAGLRALIHHVDGSPLYHIHVERSFAGYYWAWLVDAMIEFLD